MSYRPVYSLEEDFKTLGLVGSDVSDFDLEEAKKKKKKKAPYFRRDKDGWVKGNSGENGKFITKSNGDVFFIAKSDADSPPMEDMDFDDDFDLEEAKLKKIRRKRGVEKIKSRKAAKKYYRQHKAALARLQKTAKYKRRRKKLSKMGKAPKGYRRMVAHTEIDSRLANLGENLDAMQFDTRAAQLSAAYEDVVNTALSVGSGFSDLAEEYISGVGNLDVIAQACKDIAIEAAEWREACAEHDENISTADFRTIQNHLDGLTSELDDLAEMYDDIQDMISIDEGLDEEAAFVPFSPPQEYSEAPYMGPSYHEVNDFYRSAETLDHPLLLQYGMRRMSESEREVMQSQRELLGYDR